MKSIAFLAVMFLIPSPAAALQPSDFASGMTLSLEENGAVYRLTVPRDVYETVVRSDLKDLRVFNGVNAVVPHALRRPKASADLFEEAIVAPIFPLYGPGDSDGREGFSVRIEKDEEGAIINVETDGDEGGRKQKCTGYLIDLERNESRIHALDISWSGDAEDFIMVASVEYSEDLTRWRPIVTRATIAKMSFGGHEINRRRIELAPGGISAFSGSFGSGGEMETGRPGKTAYLRLLWKTDGEAVDVTGIEAIRRSGEPGLENTWTSVRGTYNAQESNSNKAVYEYDSAARFPVDEVRLGFAEKNTLVKANIFSRADDESPWRYRQGSVFYNLEVDSSALVQDTVSIGPVSDRYWRVEIIEAGPGSSGNIPVLELGWIPHELFFVARGEGPFVLAYGSARLGDEGTPGISPALLSSVVDGSAAGMLKSAAPEAEVELGGDGQLVPEPPPLPWKKWLLWGILVIGVVIIAWMAVSLGRGMGRVQDDPPSEGRG